MNELMERLAQANPAPADEAPGAEEQREAEALLERILADPLPDERRRHASRLRRLAPAAAVLAALAIAAVIVIDLADSEKGGGGIIERAVAAVSQEDVIYAITMRATSRSAALDPGIEASPDERVFQRLWLWREGNRSRTLGYRLRPDGTPGRLRGEVVSTPERIVWFDAKGRTELSYDRDRGRDQAPVSDEEDSDDGSGYPGFDPSTDPGAQLREHVDGGRLRVAGRTTVRGRTAYRLIARANPDAKPDEDFGTVTYLVDARTYMPLEVRQRAVFDYGHPDGGRERVSFRIEYLRYETLPVTDQTKKLLKKGAGRQP